MAEEDFTQVYLENMPDKYVQVPTRLLSSPLSARAYAVESGQATWEEVNGEPAADPGIDSGFQAAMIRAGATVDRFKSNIFQALQQATSSDPNAGREEMAKQAEIERLGAPVKEQYPKSSFVGEALPFFAVPGGPAAQIAFGTAAGALEGDTPLERLGYGALSGVTAYGGQKLGDYLGARTQNAIQRARGVPEAAARSQLLSSGVPMSVSERTSGPISKPLARFAERARFVLTGNAPAERAQQKAMTELLTDTFNNPAVRRLNRQGMGRVVSDLQRTFRSAASRAGQRINPDDAMIGELSGAFQNYQRVGSDSTQVNNIVDRAFREIAESYNSGNGIDADIFLKARSNLSEATTKSDLETGAIVQMIDAFDNQLRRIAPDLADDLTEARDLWRLQLALRKGAALSPQGDVNIPTFNNNLKQYFRDFDIGTPLPRTMGEAGEVAASLREVTQPFRSSGTAENAAALGIPGTFANQSPGVIAKTLSGLAMPFLGGGTGGLLGGGVARSITDQVIRDNINMLGGLQEPGI